MSGVLFSFAMTSFLVLFQISVIDRLGRRPLLVFPMLIIIFELVTITISLNLQVSDVTFELSSTSAEVALTQFLGKLILRSHKALV